MNRFDVDYIDEERGIKNIPCDDGDYVLAEDALALQAKVEELESELRRCKTVLHDYIDNEYKEENE